MFWAFTLILSGLCSLFLWRAWKNKLRSSLVVDEAGSDLSLARIRIAEIEQDLAEGRLDEQGAIAAKAEEARRILKASRDDDIVIEPSSRASGWWMTGTLVLVPLLAFALYLPLGDTPLLETVPDNDPQLETQSLDRLIETAENRLRDQPDDLQGWQVLAPVYLRQNELEKAENALRNIIRLGGADSNTYSTVGEILVSRASGEVRSEALGFFKQAVDADQRNPTAQFYIGLEALQRGEILEARSIWQAMIDGADGNEDWLPTIRERVASLDGIDPGNSEPAPDASAILELPADERQQQIEGMVASLADRLAEDPSDKAGWQRLVRAYMVLGNRELAEKALRDAGNAFPGDQTFTSQLESIMGTTGPLEGEQ